MNRVRTALQILALIGVLYCFLVSIGMLGASFKLFGKGFAESLFQMTESPIVGLFVGILATTLVQSSSTTTSITVGLVAADGLTVETAVPIIMGANIGTSVTNTLVSLGHITRREEFRRALAGATVHDFFNLITVVVLLPVELAFGYLKYTSQSVSSAFVGVGGMKFASPIKAVVKPAVSYVSDLAGESAAILSILSLIVMYLSLKLLVDLAKSLVVRRAERFLNRYMFGSALSAMVFGVALTILVQSSSITTSLMIPLLGAGILSLEKMFPYTLGANVGTTVTAMLAALSTASVASISIAFAHLFFNLTGIVLVYPIRTIRNIPIALARSLAEFVSRSRGLAIAYIIIVFYLLPLTVIFVWR